jgi:very-short-patch-repair endonuclease
MFWNRSLDWLLENYPGEEELLFLFGRNAYLKTRTAEGDRAFAHIHSNPAKKSALRAAYKCRAVVKTFAKKVKAGKDVQQQLLDAGTHKGWQSRNITSYAEKFWQNVLDSNNITYEREFLVNCNKTHYFLDFKLVCGDKLIDLEIDGKQHTYADRAESDLIRDTNLTGLGYLVYRIPWNEVNSDAGKAQMKQKIDDFLVFYNTCNKGG